MLGDVVLAVFTIGMWTGFGVLVYVVCIEPLVRHFRKGDTNE